MKDLTVKVSNMKVGDHFDFSPIWTVTRVPGGWLYANGSMSAPCVCFVSLAQANSDFQI